MIQVAQAIAALLLLAGVFGLVLLDAALEERRAHDATDARAATRTPAHDEGCRLQQPSTPGS